MKKGFTLIELMVVIAIILILAAIAVPNYLGMQMRAKKSKSASDMNTLASYIEQYYTDWGAYPPSGDLAGITLAGDLVNAAGQFSATGEEGPINYSSTLTAAALATKFADPFDPTPGHLYNYELNAAGDVWRLHTDTFTEQGTNKVVYRYSTGEAGVGTAPGLYTFIAVP